MGEGSQVLLVVIILYCILLNDNVSSLGLTTTNKKL